mgnify:CR=1 FL=1
MPSTEHMAYRYDIGVCITRVGWLYDAGYYLSVLKRHWLGGVNGEVLRAADAETCVRMEQAADTCTPSWLTLALTLTLALALALA